MNFNAILHAVLTDIKPILTEDEWRKMLGYRLTVSTRLVRQAGYVSDTWRLVCISAYYDSLEELDDTLRHELAHTLTDGLDRHSEEWRAHAIRLGSSGKIITDNEYINKFLYICPSCKEWWTMSVRIVLGRACKYCLEPIALENYSRIEQNTLPYIKPTPLWHWVV